MNEAPFAVVGGGLAGCECALRLADAGLSVVLFEQKPDHRSPAHVSDKLAELVCSNSLRSDDIASGIGLLKAELRALGSAFMACADATRVPAGKALAVDREAFAEAMTRRILEHPRITLRHRRIDSLDDPELASMETVVIAAGPVASDGLSASLADVVGERHCYFYDAIAPIVWTHSLNQDIVFRASRYGQEKGEKGGDYLNCPMNRDEYMAFYEALLGAEKVAAHDFEKEKHFEGCMPIEALAERGPKTLTFGPLKPVGFEDPRTGRRLQPCGLPDKADLCGAGPHLPHGSRAGTGRICPLRQHAPQYLRQRPAGADGGPATGCPPAFFAGRTDYRRGRLCGIRGLRSLGRPAACGSGAGPESARAAAHNRAGSAAAAPAHPRETLPAFQRPFRPYAGTGRARQKAGSQGPLQCARSGGLCAMGSGTLSRRY